MFNRTTISKVWLVAASLYFYAYWNSTYLPILIASLLFNFLIGTLINHADKHKYKKMLVSFGIISNVALLGYFKYMDFLIDNINLFFPVQFTSLNILLPLAISFFTFQQIAYLVDSYNGETKGYNFLNYSLFVTFFPQLIAGPIVHHKEVIPQYRLTSNRRPIIKNISLGIFIFFIGLFKKVLIADTFATWANKGFDNSASLTFFESWITSYSYTFQLYFDFSGYADMAIGLALLFNITLPINFNSPYQAVNIQDFWKRWHITLSRFLTKYIYIPLGGNRKSTSRTYINIIIVFFISGLWHGAGWGFIIWGLMHGGATVIYRWWSKLGLKMSHFLAWLITFNFVNIGWVFFRAETVGEAVSILKAMVGLKGVSLPQSFLSAISNLTGFEIQISTKFFLPGFKDPVIAFVMVTVFLIVVTFTRNSTEMLKNFTPSLKNAIFLAMITIISIIAINKVTEFLYFNF